MMSSRWLRRPLSITGWVLVGGLALVLSPVLFLVAGVAAALTRERKPLVLVRVVVAYLVRELLMLVACGALWLRSGAGLLMGTPTVQRWHWRLLRWFVHGVTGPAVRALDIGIAEDASNEADRALSDGGALILFSRHAGPGDTMILIDMLLSRFGRRPSVVFKQAVAFDPSVDLIAHRLPHAVLDTDDRQACEARIAATTDRLGSRGVLVLFPEGGNFTPERRRRAVRHLRQKGNHAAADAATTMNHVLPPRPLGALAALQARPDADVVFAAHTGLGLAAYPRELYREMPIGRTLTMRRWLVPRAEIPADPDEQVEWLTDWWRRIDEWIDDQGAEPRPAQAVASS